MTYGYARCSTNETKQDVNRQKRELKNKGAQHIFWEYESGTKISREELNKLLAVVQPGDTIVVTEISRLTRSIKQLCDLIELAKNKSLCFIIDLVEIDFTNGVNIMHDFMLKIMGLVAELERNMISERTKSGLAHARSKGVQLGRPPKIIENIPQKFTELYFLYRLRDIKINIAQIARELGISRTTVYKYIAIVDG